MYILGFGYCSKVDGEPMIEPRDTIIQKMWVLVIVILIATNLILLSLHLSSTSALGTSSEGGFASISGSPTAITSHLTVAMNDLSHTADMAGRTISNSAHSVSLAAVQSAKSVGHAVQDGAASAGRTVTDSVSSVARATDHVAATVSSAASLGSFIRPEDKTPVPVITPVAAAAEAKPVSQIVPQPQQPTAAQWPIHGSITTFFGVPELPFERIHTGLDISDGRPSGVTPILPFKPGRVAEVIRGGGLGNHVVVDHGGGLTSVYGHLHSVDVQVGEEVGEGTVLGYEGSTGASTGTHLHFEIRVNGQPVDPRKFINGLP